MSNPYDYDPADDYQDLDDAMNEFESDCDFQDPGGNSALRRATPSNPRNLPCPTCRRENMLTPHDRSLGYQCDGCADAQERGGWGYGEY